MRPRASAILLLFVSGCGGGYAPVHPEHRDDVALCVGTLVDLSVPATGDVVLWLTPNREHRALLAAGQDRLGCWIPGDDRARFTDVLPLLRRGAVVEVAGYHVVEPSGTRALRPLTSIDPFPGPAGR